MTSWRRLFVFTAALTLGCGAQETPRSAITVAVVDASGKAVVDAQVQISIGESQDTTAKKLAGAQFSGLTDQQETDLHELTSAALYAFLEQKHAITGGQGLDSNGCEGQ